jgi:L-lysine cyclodeaminase
VSTLLIRLRDIRDIVARIGLNELMDRTIAVLTEALQETPLAPGEMQPRAGFSDRRRPSVLEWMPYRGRAGRSVTIKVVAYQPLNSSTAGLPTIVASASLYDFATGHLVALADGVFLTALRTGAASAVVSRILAHPDSTTVGLVGAGAQAVSQLHALSRVFRLREALVHDVDPGIARSFPARVAFLGVPIRVAPLEEVERGADILCTATTVAPGAGPVIRGGDLRRHVHINAIGSDLPGKTELPLDVLRASLVCPDFLEQARTEGECQQLAEGEIGPDLSELVRRPHDFRPWAERRTVFDSTGTALEDHAALGVLLEAARGLGLGRRVRLEHLPADPHNPYDFTEAHRPSHPARVAGSRGTAARPKRFEEPTSMRLTHEQSESYEERGFVFLPGCLSPPEVAAMKAELPAVYAWDTPGKVLEKDASTVRMVHGIRPGDEVFGRLVRHPKILAPVMQVLGSPAYVHQFKVNAKAAFDGDVWQWHQDYVYLREEDLLPSPRVTNAVVFLDEVNEFNGPLLLIPGSHKEGMLSVTTDREQHPAYKDKPSWIAAQTTRLKYTIGRETLARLVGRGGIAAPKGPAGSVLLFHPDCVHGSAPNMSPWDRAIVVINYNSIENLPDGISPRPEFLASRDFRPLEPLPVADLVPGHAG